MKTTSSRRLLAAAALLLLACTANAGFLRPRWTRAKPHYETRRGHKVAIAVGTAKDANLALARSTAEERARADLLRLLQGMPPLADAEGRVAGAVAAEVYKSGRRVYVRLELDVTQPLVPAPDAAAPTSAP